jgi:hypothetical protein
VAEGSADCLGQGPGAIDDEQPQHRRIEPALDQVVDERLDGRGVLRRTLDEAERMLVTLRVDANRRNQNQILVETGKIGCHPLLHARRR